MKLSVVLATRNEEENIERCLASVKSIADEIIVFDEYSTDNTVSIAKKYGANVFLVNHEPIFHVTKQKAINKAQGDWVLQLDADEVVTKELASEIMAVLAMSQDEIKARRNQNTNDEKLFTKHASFFESDRGGMVQKNDEIVAFFISRVNMFLGYPLIYGGVFPDGVIRLFKKGKALLPGKSVHEQMEVQGKVAWLFNSMEHWDSPTMFRYLARLNRYTELKAEEMVSLKTPKSMFYILLYSMYEPIKRFLQIFIRHRGYKDGIYGFIWAAFSAWHYPISYFKYLEK